MFAITLCQNAILFTNKDRFLFSSPEFRESRDICWRQSIDKVNLVYRQQEPFTRAATIFDPCSHLLFHGGFEFPGRTNPKYHFENMHSSKSPTRMEKHRSSREVDVSGRCSVLDQNAFSETHKRINSRRICSSP